MIKRNTRRARATVLLAVGLLGLSTIPATAAPPTNDVGDFTFPAGTVCEFAVHLAWDGKKKIIGKETETHKVTAPGLKVITTAVDSEGNPISEPVEYTATGTVNYTLTHRPDGSAYFEVKATGQNILGVPRRTETGEVDEDAGFDLVYVVGNVNFAMKLDKQTEIRPFSGEARQTNICGPLTP